MKIILVLQQMANQCTKAWYYDISESWQSYEMIAGKSKNQWTRKDLSNYII